MAKIEAKGPIVSSESAWFYNWIGWQCTDPARISRELEQAAGDEVVLEINSTGGSVMAGYEIYKSIMDYPGKVTAHIIIACSAATFLACAADEARISDGGIFMIHNVQSYADGDYRDMQMEADALRQFNEGLINIYERKTRKSREELQKLMDENTYMGPTMAIEQGFVDGLIYDQQGISVENEGKVNDFVCSLAASSIPAISADKAQKMLAALKKMNVAPVQHPYESHEQDIGSNAESDIKQNEGGKNRMTLQEFLAENPEANAEIDALADEALAKGRAQERERIKSLDAISATVPAVMLTEAKYGESPLDGPTLAYQAMMKGEKAATAYMASAIRDVETSGATAVGVGSVAEQEEKSEADMLAGFVNKSKGGR